MSDSGVVPPPLLAADTLRVLPVGGLGDIGRNMTVFEYDGALLVLDCGVLFPEDSQPGIDVILPDLNIVRDRVADIVGIVLTHGHEDHIGAVPHLLKIRGDIPVFGSALTLAFLRAKAKEHRIKPVLIEVSDREQVSIGPFSAEFLSVTHSIPDSMAVCLSTAAGRILHTGDFKADQLPLDGRLTDLNSFARLGDEGVDVLMVDSTNAEVPGFVPSEREIQPVLDNIFNRAPGRIIVASFASHVHRIQQIVDLATKHGRKLAFVGRSMVRNMSLARDLGYLSIPAETWVSMDEFPGLADDECVLVCTGSQGEPMSALSRMAKGDHVIHVNESDTVILASSLIPGNENAVNRVINGLMRTGARVVHRGNALVHVSGHASAGELRFVYNLVKPRFVIPVHGEWRHLVANGAIARSVGIPAERVLVIQDGTSVDVQNGAAWVSGRVPVEDVFVHGSSVGVITESSLADRRVLGEEGFLSVFAVVDLETGVVVVGPELQERGFGAEGDSVGFDEVSSLARKALEDALGEGIRDTYDLQQRMRRVVGRWVSSTHARRPMIVPVVIAMPEPLP